MSAGTVAPQPFNWEERFGQRHDLRYTTENKAREAIRRRVAPEADTIKFFMQIDDDSPAAFYRAELLKAVCPESVLKKLAQNQATQPANKTAWLDERSYEAQEASVNAHRGSLSALELLWALQQKRFTESREAESGEISDADRRLIYITNLDSWTIGALVLTASNQFSWAMSGFLFNHLALRPLIDARIKPTKLAVFSLEFHLPYFAWRTGPGREDPRRKANGRRLRKSWPLGFLMKDKTREAGGQDCIYEACVSCVLTGYNDYIWTGCLGVDTYFDDASQSQDHVENFDNNQPMRSDPLLASHGEHHDANKPIWDPREYFLRVLAARLRKVACEWGNVVTRLDGGMKGWIRKVELGSSGSLSTFPKRSRSSATIAATYSWTLEVNVVLEALTQNLDETVKAWETFDSLQSHCIFTASSSAGTPQNFSIPLYEIQRSFAELQKLNRDLHHLRDTYDRFKHSLELHLSILSNEGAIVLQQVNITMLHVISPPALAAGIVQAGLTPFPNQFLNFLIITVLCAAVTLTAQPVLMWWSTRKSKASITYPSPPGELLSNIQT
ncbi:hypothetical protein GQ53DRAFT_131035 [Thozetella sp. PMI_491]|nr:hypothetical protein GQ53DRAFT_131035 [Thozetella sp. PMI_491]